MDFLVLKDVIVVSYAVLVEVPYVRGEGFFAYPASALLLAIVWEGLGWSGGRSILVLAVVAVAAATASLIRRRSTEPVFVWRVGNPLGPALVMMGLFGACVLAVLIVGALIP